MIDQKIPPTMTLVMPSELEYGAELVAASVVHRFPISRRAEIMVVHTQVRYPDQASRTHKVMLAKIVDGRATTVLALRAEHVAAIASALVEVSKVAAFDHAAAGGAR